MELFVAMLILVLGRMSTLVVLFRFIYASVEEVWG